MEVATRWAKVRNGALGYHGAPASLQAKRLISAAQLRRATTPAVSDAPHAVRLNFAGIVAQLRTSECALADELRAKYSAHVADEDAAFTYFVCESERGYSFWCAHDGAWEWCDGELPPDALAFLTDAALLSAVVHADRNMRSIHAAALAYDGKGAIIAGDSTAGKTTTLLACARSGMQIFSDERALMRGGMLHPFLRRCRVRGGGRALLLQDDGDDTLARQLRAGHNEINLAACFPSRVAGGPAPLKAVFVLHSLGTAPAVEPIEAAAALPAVSRWFDMRADRLTRIATALSLLSECACYRLTLGTPAQTARTIRSVLEGLA
jgi:hypothetical protein